MPDSSLNLLIAGMVACSTQILSSVRLHNSLPIDSDMLPGPKGATQIEDPAVASGSSTVLAVGDYLVGDTEDEGLSGHPDIRY
ncbi:hypothetical protein [Hymenobacter fastidiosus]|uniref:hypothetical protein n=1 Tax=Hymenobacter fastidiosus TaxID=486264 RepID=UPI0031E6D3F3